MLGLSLRFLIAGISFGSNDAIAFWQFANHIQQRGLFQAYRDNADINHPPIPLLWASTVLSLTVSQPGVPEKLTDAELSDMLGRFLLVLKLPGILADGLVCWILYSLWRARRSELTGLIAAAFYAWALSPILVSSYHGNSDNIYAALSLLAVYLMQTKRHAFMAGLVLGAAINVKLIPVFLIPAFLAGLTTRRQAMLFLAALALCALPFVPLFFTIGPEFYRNALAYKPIPDRWGFMLPMTWNGAHPPTRENDSALLTFMEYGRFFILGLIVIWSIFAARIRSQGLYTACAGTYAIFLVFASGFGVQYTVVIAPLLFAVSWRIGFVYSTISGLFLLCTYWYFWEGGIPFASRFYGYFPQEAALLGALTWITLATFLGWLVTRALRRTPASQPLAAQPELA